MSHHAHWADRVGAIDRRHIVKLAGSAAIAANFAAPANAAQTTSNPVAPESADARPAASGLRKRMIGYMLAHEQFPIPELIEIGAIADQAGFHLLATSDHFQPWQPNEGHAGEAWVTLGALGARARSTWMGTTVTCPILRYDPAVVAEAFATLSWLYPGRIFLGVGSGEALNEQAATGTWPRWPERWDRLVEAIGIIRELWTGRPVSHEGQYYRVNGKLYDPPPHPVPLLTAANGRKSMRLAGQHGDGLITDPRTWSKHKSEWEAGARDSGKNPAEMPVLIEQYVVVGERDQAKPAAELWRFGPKAFKTYFNIRDPATIQQQAETQVPLDEVLSTWAVGTEPSVHVNKLTDLFDSGATIVNVHCPQPDQRAVLQFYGSQVLPALRERG